MEGAERLEGTSIFAKPLQDFHQSLSLEMLEKGKSRFTKNDAEV